MDGHWDEFWSMIRWSTMPFFTQLSHWRVVFPRGGPSILPRGAPTASKELLLMNRKYLAYFSSRFKPPPLAPSLPYFKNGIHKPPASIRFAPIKHALAVTVEPFKFSPA